MARAIIFHSKDLKVERASHCALCFVWNSKVVSSTYESKDARVSSLTASPKFVLLRQVDDEPENKRKINRDRNFGSFILQNLNGFYWNSIYLKNHYNHKNQSNSESKEMVTSANCSNPQFTKMVICNEKNNREMMKSI